MSDAGSPPQAPAKKGLSKFVESRGGALDVERIFPGIARSADPAAARWQAQVWLAARLAQSPFWPIGPGVDLLVSALLARYDQALVGNIVLVAARHDEWAAAAAVIASCMQAHSSPFLHDLAGIAARQDKHALSKMPLMTIADGALAFDMQRQLSRARLFKKAG